ncbi:unnamed protein product [Fusarium graminearum]|nr:unnamed protein product [Fusarium graminearum]
MPWTGDSGRLSERLKLGIVLVPDVISILVQVLNIGNDSVLQASPARSTKVLQQLLGLVSRLDLVGVLSIREVLGECLLRVVLSEDIENLVPVEATGKAKDALILDVVEDGGRNVKSSSVVDIDEVFYHKLVQGFHDLGEWRGLRGAVRRCIVATLFL